MSHGFNISSTDSVPNLTYEQATSGLSRNTAVSLFTRVRKKLAEHYKRGSSISSIYRDTLRSIRNIFGNFYYIDGDENLTKVNCITGNPERSIAKLFQESNIVLPIISVVQTASDDDDDRRRYVPQLVVDSVWDDSIRRAQRVISVVPRPVNINYEIIVWSKYNEDMDHIATQIRASFNPSLDVQTPHSDLTKSFIIEEENTGSFDAGDREDRILRKIFRISVESYIPSPKFLITNTGKIIEFNAEVQTFNS